MTVKPPREFIHFTAAEPVITDREATQKVCTHCRQRKDLAAFSRCTANPDGLQTWCHLCQSTYKDTWDPTVAWDGTSQYSLSPTPRRSYEVKCFAAGHVTATYRLTDGRARQVRISGHCGTCGSALFLESADDGQIHSTMRGQYGGAEWAS